MEPLSPTSHAFSQQESARWQPDRRTWLQLAGAGSATWLARVAGVLAAEAPLNLSKEPARAVILLWLAGGPSQLETFDPQPGQSIAGGTRAIETAVPGIQLAAGLPQLADQMESISLIRSMVSKEGDHERGTYLVKSGYRPNPTLVHPSIGAICASQLPVGGTEIPRHISILAGQWPGQGGFLGARYDAFQMGDPRGPVPDVAPRVSKERLERRLADLDIVQRAFAQGRAAQVKATGHRATIAAARRMMRSDQLQAFDVSREPQALRDRYGDTPFGRGCLAARRLVEVGVRCVEVTLSGWDSHVNNHAIHQRQTGILDPAFATLVADLRARDLLARTVVLCGGEFGRTPQLNRLEGRDHWPHGFSMALAGGGLRGGQVVGATDPEGSQRVADPCPVANLHATILTALGLDPEQETITPSGRPVKLSEGVPIDALLEG